MSKGRTNYKPEEKEKEIFSERDRKLVEVRNKRKAKRKEAGKLQQPRPVKAAQHPKGLALTAKEIHIAISGD